MNTANEQLIVIRMSDVHPNTCKIDRPTTREAAIRYLAKAMANGPRYARELQAGAWRRGIGIRTLRRAARDLGITTYRDTPTGPWIWAMGDDDLAF